MVQYSKITEARLKMKVKDKVLEYLINSGGSVSGEEMAKNLGVSRNAVWKSIKALQGDGYEICGVNNKGYILKNDNDILSVQAIKKRLESALIGRELIVLSETASTNNYAKELAAEGAPEGTAVIARAQTGGKGRLGRSFFSPKDMGVYISVILRPKCLAENNILITSMAAVAAARAIEKVCGGEVRIKWVNDLYVGGKKICGILTEALLDFESGIPEYIILGIGVNVKKTEFPDELKDIATSLENETGESISKSDIAAQILNELDKLYKNFERGDFLEESRSRSNVIGKDINIMRGSEKYRAKAVGIDDRGGLIVDNDGVVSVLYSGEISVRVIKNED